MPSALHMTNPPDRELAVFSDARRLPSGERAAYLDKACAGDAALRQRVEELLQASDEVGNFLGALIGLFGAAVGLGGALVGIYFGLKNQKQEQTHSDEAKRAA